jgi:hypothetical protein
MGDRAYYEGLPIYRAAMDTTVAVHQAVRGFARFHKYGLGAELQRQSIAIALLVAAANRRSERAEALPRLCAAAENLKILVNLGRELEAFASFAQYAGLATRTVDLARQAEAWRRHSLGQTGPERSGGPQRGAT